MIVEHELKARTSPARGYCGHDAGKVCLVCCRATEGPTRTLCGVQAPAGGSTDGETTNCAKCASVNQDPDVCPLFGRCIGG